MEGLILIPTLDFDYDDTVPVGIDEIQLKRSATDRKLEIDFPDFYMWLDLGSPFRTAIKRNHYFIQRIPFESGDQVVKAAILAHNNAQHLLEFLWFIKDSSPQSSMYAVYTKNKYRGIFNTNQAMTNSSGLSETIKFTADEVVKAIEIKNKYFSISPDGVKPAFEFDFSKVSSFRGDVADSPYNTKKRLERAMGFLRIARCSAHLPLKISFYVLVLECLFVPNEKSEIQYKLCDRTAIYIGDGNIERHYIYELLKEGYNLRSRYVHGDELDKTHNIFANLIKLSFNLDDLVRKVLIKVIYNDSEIFNMKSDKLSKWLNEQKFGSY